jgi:BirA family biotin operon repressor/biotin-[acetyl-CoA-carboxylase] ligase
LAAPVELLQADQIFAAIPVTDRNSLHRLDILHEVDSTNAYLLEQAKQSDVSGVACLAEHQLAGRGRRGRNWVSPFGGNLYVSLLWRFSAGLTQLGGLSLAMAVALTRCLRDIGVQDVGVKWPNDILVHGQKLAGILLEVAGEAAGPCCVVVGVGLNVRATKSQMAGVDQPWTDVESLLGFPTARNQLAGNLLGHLLRALREFEIQGLEGFLEEWRERDIFAGREVVLQMPQGEVNGVAQGVDTSGALLLAGNNGLQRYHSGEVSLRSVP